MNLDYHIEIISQFTKGEWFKPTNFNSNAFFVCADLFEWGLIERKIEDVFIDNRIVGRNFYFKYD
jgi:hypothetical protein